MRSGYQASCMMWITLLATNSRVAAPYAAICGAAAWALGASMLSHFSTTTNVSGPHGVWNGQVFITRNITAESIHALFSAVGAVAVPWSR